MIKAFKVCRFFDSIFYLMAQIGIFVAAFNGSLVWVCVCGFCLIDGGITLLFGKRLMPKED